MKKKFTRLSFHVFGFFISLTFIFQLLPFNRLQAQAGEWTWMKGSSFSNPPGIFGTMGVADPANTPPALYEPYEWTDKQGNFWLFGGWDGNYNYWNTLWKFNVSSNEWMWVRGSSSVNAPTVYGTQGVPAASNDPGGRFSGATWIDTTGNFWLFGGFVVSNGISSDLWKYDISTNEWTWMKGPNTNMNPGTYGTQGVEDSNNNPAYRSETNSAWTDNENNLWLFGGGDNGSTSYNDLWRYNPSTNNWTWMKGSNSLNQPGVYGTIGVADPANTPAARMVYTRWKDAAGNFWLYGGRNINFSGFNDLWKYNVVTNEWTWVSGTSTLSSSGNYGTLCIADSAFISSNRTENRAVWTDACGNFWFFGGANNSYTSVYSDLWLYNITADEWVLASGNSSPNSGGNYGTQGVSSPTNIPPALWGSSGWTDTDGNLWLFGGSAIWPDFKNALWKYVPDPACGGCVVQLPQVSFLASDPEICEKFCIDYTDQSINNPTSWQWIFPGGSPSFSIDQNPTGICYTVPGTYDVTLITTNASGSDTLTLTNYITVYPTPPFPTITQNGYTLTSSPSASYQWQLNSADIPGATNQSYAILQTGYYTVLAGDSNGCKNSATTYVLISGIPDLNDTNISIYPNPTSGSFTVEFSPAASSANKQLEIEVVNTLGQIVFSSEEMVSFTQGSAGSPGKVEIDLDPCGRDARSCVVTGIYFIEINSGSTIFRQKLILTR